MKIEVELEDSIYQTLFRLLPGMDIGTMLSEMIKGMVFTAATHLEAIERAYMEDSTEDKLFLLEESHKWRCKAMDKARETIIVCTEEDCGTEFYVPKGAEEVACPGCGAHYRNIEAKVE